MVNRFDMPTLGDYMRQEEEFKLRKQKAQQAAQTGGGSIPAPLQLANEYQRRIKAGDVEGANLLMQFAKTVDRGVGISPEGGYTALEGYGKAVGDIAGQKKGMETQATQEVKAATEPGIQRDITTAKLEQELEYRPKIEEAKTQAADIAKKKIELGERKASLPQLEDTIEQLRELGKKATYTMAGQASDVITRQLGLPVGEGAKARVEYISLVDNQILPLLRQTFGAAFTAKEGESLRATLGNPNVSPEEKEAVLRSFINQKKATIASLERETGAAPTATKINPANIPMDAAKQLKANPASAAQFDEIFGEGASALVLGR